MVQCYSCSSTINGTWAINTAGYNNGAYLGVDAYFAYNGYNWVYCFCPNCFNNGNFANIMRSWYPTQVSQILANQNSQISTLQSTKLNLQARIKDLQQRILTLQQNITKTEAQRLKYQTSYNQLSSRYSSLEQQNKKIQQLFPNSCIDSLIKVEEFENTLKDCSQQIYSQFSSYKGKIINKNIENFTNIVSNSIKATIQMIEKKLKSHKSDNDRIEKIKVQTCELMKQLKSEQTNSNLFLDQDIQKLEEIFTQRIINKELQFKNLFLSLEKANAILSTIFK